MPLRNCLLSFCSPAPQPSKGLGLGGGGAEGKKAPATSGPEATCQRADQLKYGLHGKILNLVSTFRGELQVGIDNWMTPASFSPSLAGDPYAMPAQPRHSGIPRTKVRCLMVWFFPFVAS